MIIDDRHYDFIIIGSGAAGGTMARSLASGGHAVLLLERGQQMPLADQNVADVDLFRKDRYHPKEQWFGTDGDPFSPQTIYALGGNTKIWGGVLERLREQEWAGLALQAGQAPGWGLSQGDFEPWYDQAERLYRVHGQRGIDPTEPAAARPYDFAPRPVEPFFEELRLAFGRQGVRPYPLPLSWSELAADPSGDAELFGVDLACASTSFVVRSGAEVRRLHVNPSGTEVRGVEAQIDGQLWLFAADQVVLAAGAGCLDIWPPLARQLGISWAGVLALETNPGNNPWLRQVAKGRLVLNQQEQRLGLEDQAGWLAEERWIVDASAAPWGPKGVLVGQISLVRPLDGTRQAPDPVRMEQRLRQGLQGWDPQLAALVGTYRQIPVAFGLQGRALVGPVPGALGLWTFTGFRSPFSTAPLLAAQLAQSLATKLTNQTQPNIS